MNFKLLSPGARQSMVLGSLSVLVLGGWILSSSDFRQPSSEPNSAECKILSLRHYSIKTSHAETDIQIIEHQIRQLIFAALHGNTLAQRRLKQIRFARQQASEQQALLAQRYGPYLEALEHCPRQEKYLSSDEQATLDEVYELLERGPYALRHRAAELITLYFNSPRAIHAIETYILNYGADGEVERFSIWLGELDNESAFNALLIIGRSEPHRALFRLAAIEGFTKMNQDDLLARAKIEIEGYWGELRQHPPQTEMEWQLLDSIENSLYRYYQWWQPRVAERKIDPATTTGAPLATAIVIGRIPFGKGQTYPQSQIDHIAQQLYDLIASSSNPNQRRLGIRALERMASANQDLHTLVPRLITLVDTEPVERNQNLLLHVLFYNQPRPEFLRTLAQLVLRPTRGLARGVAMKELALQFQFSIQSPDWEVRKEIIPQIRSAVPNELDAEVNFQMSRAIKEFDAEVNSREGRK